ncbi:DUF928 domain-containing protein [Pantanalinema rosaneae CENA516]|uniref:DUF928 domain-containing protein n=1 Tax=Pantanalinema rosaneae TaxID=1620701 RepID=UPI003D6F80BD
MTFVSQSSYATTPTSGNSLVFKQLPQADGSVPGNILGRGTRNPGDNLCGKTDTPLIALAPHLSKTIRESQPNSDQVLSLTSAALPTFWFYTPYQPNGNLTANFEIRQQVNGSLRRVSRQSVQIASQPGLLSVPLQDTPLASNQRYQWVLSVQCVPSDPSANDSVSGWIERVDSDQASNPLQPAKTAQQKVQAYAQAGLWHETLTTIAGELCHSDRNQAQRWFVDLMQSVNLGIVAQQPKTSLLQSCPKL